MLCDELKNKLPDPKQLENEIRKEIGTMESMDKPNNKRITSR